MANTMNPFGVGHSGDDKVIRQGRCACCGLPFAYEVVRAQSETRLRCLLCEPHYEIDDERVERTLARLADHERRYREWAKAASRKATEYEREVGERRGQVRAALSNRDAWRNLAVDMFIPHEEFDGQCACGVAAPCPTIQAVENQGRHLLGRLHALASRRVSPEDIDADDYLDDEFLGDAG